MVPFGSGRTISGTPFDRGGRRVRNTRRRRYARGESDRTVTVLVAAPATTRAGTVARDERCFEIVHGRGSLIARRCCAVGNPDRVARASVDKVLNSVQVLQVFAIAEADRQILRRQAPWPSRNDVPVHCFGTEQRRRIDDYVTGFLEQVAQRRLGEKAQVRDVQDTVGFVLPSAGR